MDHIKNALDSLTCATPRKPEELMDKDKEKYKTFITLGEDAEAEKKHPVPEVEWVQGYTHGKCAAHPHAAVATSDGGYLLVGDCTTYHGTGDVGTGEDWPANLKRAILVTKTNATGDFEWSCRFGHIGMNYGKFGTELPDGSFVVGGVAAVDDDSCPTDFLYVQRRCILRISKEGKIIKSTVFPAANPDDPGRRDGVMGLAAENGIAEDGGMVVYATGYVSGEAGYNKDTHEYDDDPMFLINLGRTFVAQLTFLPVDKEPYGLMAQDPTVSWYTPIEAGTQGSLAFRQGMRIVIDRLNSQLAVLTTACEAEDKFDAQFGCLALGLDGEVRWAKMYPAKDSSGSHPYALCLSSNGEYLIAGHAIENGVFTDKGPAGRACKLDPSSGELLWDTRFKQPGQHMNTECYGICLLTNCNGVLITCGTGVMPDEHPDDPDEMKTWMVLNVHLDESTGALRWLKPYTERLEGKNNAGEFALATKDGGAVILIDSQSYGSPETGGNFALAKLAPFN